MASRQRAGMLRSVSTVGLTVLFGGGVVPALAGQTELLTGLDTRFTDNARKSSSNEISDLESRAYVNAGYTSDPGRCNSDFSGTLGYRYWQDSTFDNESYAEMDFAGDCELANQLYWDAANTLREVNQSSREGDTPDNRTRKNVFSSGPRYVWRLNNTNWLTLSALYQNTEFSEPEESDSERYTGSVAWSHAFSQALSSGLSTSYSRTEYDTGAEVDVTSARVTFSKLWATMNVSGAIGASEIETRFGTTTQTSDGLVGELDLTRSLTPSAEWFLRAARELTDRTSTFDFRFGEFQFSLQDSISVEVTSIATGLSKRFSDSGLLTVEAYANQSDYLQSNEQEDSTGLNLRYSRPVAERTNASLGLGYDYQTYASDDVDDRRARLELGMEYLASRDLSLNARVGHESKISDLPTSEYEENWVLLGLEYRFR